MMTLKFLYYIAIRTLSCVLKMHFEHEIYARTFCEMYLPFNNCIDDSHSAKLRNAYLAINYHRTNFGFETS